MSKHKFEMEHPGNQKLENYIKRQISGDEMTALILHLEVCAECAAKVKDLSENRSVRLFTETEKFHLDYNEHLRPFVDSEADAATREIVESHTQACANCAFQLRELREFAQSLRLREIEKTNNKPSNIFAKISTIFRRISPNFAFRIVLPLVVIIGIAALVWFLVSKKPVEISLQENENRITQNIVIPTELNTNNLQNDLPTLQTSLPVNNANLQKVTPKPSPTETELSGDLENIPNNLQILIQKTLQSGKIEFPNFLTSITPNLNLRGNVLTDSVVKYPAGEAITKSRPIFKWTNISKKQNNYTVEIYDENGELIEKSPVINALSWRPSKDLLTEKIYSWELKIENGETSTADSAKFKIIAPSILARWRLNSVKSPLVRGIIYASNGILTQALAEFRKAAKNPREAELARKFLAQIKKTN